MLLEDLSVVLQVIGQGHLVELAANPAVSRVHPVGALLDLVVAQDSREDDFVHVARHRVLLEQVLSDLVDAHEQESELTCRPVLVLFEDLHLGPLFVPLNLQLAHLLEQVFLVLRPARVLLVRCLAEFLVGLHDGILQALELLSLIRDVLLLFLVDSLQLGPLGL